MTLAWVILLSTFFAHLFLSLLIFRRSTQTKHVVQYPKVLFVVGTLCVLVAVSILFVLLWTKSYDPIVVLWLPFGIGVYLVLRCVVWRIEYGKDKLIHRNMLGFKKAFSYKDIKMIKLKKNAYYVLVFDHYRIVVDMMCTNSDIFFKVINKNKAKSTPIDET